MKYAKPLTETQMRNAFLYCVVNNVPVPVIARRIRASQESVTRYLIKATCMDSKLGIGRRRLRWQ